MSGVRVSHLGPQPLKSFDFRGCFLTSYFITSSKLTTLTYLPVIFDLLLYFSLNCSIINIEKLSNYNIIITELWQEIPRGSMSHSEGRIL